MLHFFSDSFSRRSGRDPKDGGRQSLDPAFYPDTLGIVLTTGVQQTFCSLLFFGTVEPRVLSTQTAAR